MDGRILRTCVLALVVLMGLVAAGCSSTSADDRLIEDLLAEDFHDIEIDGWSRGKSLADPTGEVFVVRGDEREVTGTELEFVAGGSDIWVRSIQTTERLGAHFLTAIWNSADPIEQAADAEAAVRTVVASAESDGYVVVEERCDDELYVLAATLDSQGAVVVVETTTVVASSALVVSQSTLTADLRTEPGFDFEIRPAATRCATAPG